MYIALKDLNLSGVRYMAGEDIPEEAVVPNRAAALIRSGYIAKHGDKDSAVDADANHARGIPVHMQKSGEDIFLYLSFCRRMQKTPPQHLRNRTVVTYWKLYGSWTAGRASGQRQKLS